MRRPVRPFGVAAGRAGRLAPGRGRRRGRRRGTGRRRRAGASAGRTTGTGAKFLGDGAGEQAQEHGGGRFGQGLAGAVVRHHAVAQQLGGDAAGEFAVGGDQRGAGTGGFQGVAQHQGDGRRLPPAGRRGARRLDAARGCGGSLAPGVQGIGGQQGAAERREAFGRHGRWRLERPGLEVPSCGAQAGQEATQAGLRVGVFQLVPGGLVLSWCRLLLAVRGRR